MTEQVRLPRLLRRELDGGGRLKEAGRLHPTALWAEMNLFPLSRAGMTLTEDDLLGVSYDGSVLLVNFSQKLMTATEGMDGKEVEHMVYGLVDTLCCLPGVKRVALFIAGQQPENLGGTIYLPGDFMPNPVTEE